MAATEACRSPKTQPFPEQIDVIDYFPLFFLQFLEYILLS